MYFKKQPLIFLVESENPLPCNFAHNSKEFPIKSVDASIYALIDSVLFWAVIEFLFG